MAITLFDVKKFNDYDFISETQPTQDGSWLKISDGTSYEVVNSVATQIEQAQDLRIQDSIYPTLENALEYINNYFYVVRQTQDRYKYTHRFEEYYRIYPPQDYEIERYESDSAFYSFDGVNKTIDNLEQDVFQVGDFIRVNYALRNNLIASVTAKTATQLTIDNDELRTVDENASIFLCDIPKVVCQLVAQMINFDIFEREVTDLDSETVGNYSYSKSKPVNGMLDYPVNIMSRLDTYKMVRFT